MSVLSLYNTSTANSSKGLYSEAQGLSGITYGVYGRDWSADGYGGYFDNTAVNGVGLFASGGGSVAADIVLGGTASGGNDDDGRILSDPAYTGSDIYLVSNDAIVLDLDDDNNEDSALEVRNTNKTTVLKANENGNVHMGIDAGATPIAIGDRYRDNGIVAWAKISSGGGSFSISSEFGVALATKDAGVGSYTIALDASSAGAAYLIPMAVAEIDTQPNSAAGLRIVSVNQVDASTFQVFINNGNGTPVDNDFVFMVTAR